MRYTAKDGVLTGKSGYETLRIEAFGRGLRVRATVKPVFSAWDKALCSAGNVRADVRLHDGGAT